MPVEPKRKLTRSRTGHRRSKWKLSKPNLQECPRCHDPKLPHRVCRSCGHYKDREVLPQ